MIVAVAPLEPKDTDSYTASSALSTSSKLYAIVYVLPIVTGNEAPVI